MYYMILRSARVNGTKISDINRKQRNTIEVRAFIWSLQLKKYMHGIIISSAVIVFFIGALGIINIASVYSRQGNVFSGCIGQTGRSAAGGEADTGRNTGNKDENTNKNMLSKNQDAGQNTLGKDEDMGQNTLNKDADTGAGAGTESGASAALQEKKKIALTFDDGPDAEYTPMLLDGLAARGVKATFFVIGREAEEQPELMERLVKEGHLIGNHTYSHVNLQNLTDSAAKKEIKKANAVIAKYTGEEPCFLRPPFGSASSKMEKEMEMIQVLWSIDTMDWSCKDEGRICSTVYREIEENSIILMHDEYPATIRAALSIIDNLQKEGYEFVTVDEIIMK